MLDIMEITENKELLEEMNKVYNKLSKSTINIHESLDVDHNKIVDELLLGEDK